MPTLRSSKIPKPTDAQEFENIVLSSCKIKWDSPNFQKNGRRGQGQNSVDLYGQDDLMRLVGVQCKNYASGIDIELVKSEAQLAENFEPKLAAFYVACSSENDSKLQKEVRLLSEERIGKGKFPISVIFWDDIIDSLLSVKTEISKHYPEIGSTLKASQKRDDLFNFNLFSLVYEGFLIDQSMDFILAPNNAGHKIGGMRRGNR